jgi:predicted deacetylase
LSGQNQTDIEMAVKPLGGLNFTVSLFLIFFYKPLKKVLPFLGNNKKKREDLGVSIVIIISIITFLIYFLVISFILKNSLQNYKCDLIYNEVGERNVILRVDDIQAHSWFDVQYKIIEDANKKNMTLVLGVIPKILDKHLIHDDYRIYKLVQENKCNMEIALHGYTHGGDDGEFSNLSFDEANHLIRKGKKELKKFKTEIITFIPPNNAISNESSNAVYFNGIKVISAGYLSGQYGLTSSTFNSEDGKTEHYTTVLKQCEVTLMQNRTCVIVIHPQDYLTSGKIDEEKYLNYILLLEGIQDLNVTVINFRDLETKEYIRLN